MAVGPCQVGLYRRRAAELNDRHFAGKHRLQRHGASRDRDRFDGESVFFIKVGFLGKPHGHLRRAHRAAADTNSFQFFVLGRGLRVPRRGTYQDQRNDTKRLVHDHLLGAGSHG